MSFRGLGAAELLVSRIALDVGKDEFFARLRHVTEDALPHFERLGHRESRIVREGSLQSQLVELFVMNMNLRRVEMKDVRDLLNRGIQNVVEIKRLTGRGCHRVQRR